METKKSNKFLLSHFIIINVINIYWSILLIIYYYQMIIYQY